MMARRQKILLLIMLTVFAVAVNAQQIAFPGAEGYGKYVTGGRGTASVPTTVFAVTSLADDGSVGTLRWALNQTATYRTIVFRVSGTIHLLSDLKISKANTTIAGQTAPGDGICLADYTFSVSATNVIVRYIRCRLGDKNQLITTPANCGMPVPPFTGSCKPLNGSGSDDGFNSVEKDNIIIDHCTISWSTDEALSFYRANNLTLQWNLISEPLQYSYHFETGDTDWERHGFGGIWGGYHSSFHHNLLAHCHGRSPRFDGGRNLGDGATVGLENCDFRNNVIYNWGGYNLNGGEGGNYNVVNNYYKYGPSTGTNTAAGVNVRSEIINPWKEAPLPYGKYYLSGNYVESYAAVTNNNWLGASFYQGSLNDTTNSKVTTPFPLMYMPTEPALNIYEPVLKGAGAVLPKRDTLDQRIINNVRNRTGKVIDVQGGYPHGTAYSSTVNAWPTLVSTAAPTDTDGDGMYDGWETRRGLNMNASADRNNYNINGYTNLENYLNGDSIVAVGTANTCIAAPAINVSNTNNWYDAKDTTYQKWMSTDTNNVVASIKGLGNYGSFYTTYYVTNTVRTANLSGSGATAYLNRNITLIPFTPANIMGPVTVRLYITKAELNALKTADPTVVTIADVRILQTAASSCATAIAAPFTLIVPTATGEWGTFKTGYYIEFQTASFGTFFFASYNAVVPLTLLSFNGNLQQSKVKLRWSTSNEVNTKSFEVERSIDGTTFSSIGSVNAVQGSSANQYVFYDENPFVGLAYYRLKQVDKNTAYGYSHTININNRKIEQLSVSPNPVKGNSLTLTHPLSSNGTLVVVSIEGKKLIQKSIGINSAQTVIDISTLNKGVYMIVFNSTGYRQNIMFVKE